MIIQFMVAENQWYNSEMEYKIVDSYSREETGFIAYDIYEVETNDFRKIRTVFENGTEYEADEIAEFKDGNKTKYVVKTWAPIK